MIGNRAPRSRRASGITRTVSAHVIRNFNRAQPGNGWCISPDRAYALVTKLEIQSNIMLVENFR